MSVQTMDASAKIQRHMFSQCGRWARFIWARSMPVTEPSLTERDCGLKISKDV